MHIRALMHVMPIMHDSLIRFAAGAGLAERDRRWQATTGFSRWIGMTIAAILFRGQLQPRVPYDLGDLFVSSDRPCPLVGKPTTKLFMNDDLNIVSAVRFLESRKNRAGLPVIFRGVGTRVDAQGICCKQSRGDLIK